MARIVQIQAPTGFYSASAAQVWGTSPLQPPEARSAIPGELQAACRRYIELFPPPKGDSWGKFWGDFAIATVGIFTMGCAAAAVAGAAGAAGAASSAGAAASAGSAGTAAAGTATATTAGAAGAAAGSAGASTGLTLSSAMGAIQTGAGYVATGAGIVAKATGNTNAAKLAQAADVVANTKTLPQTASNLASALMPPGSDYLTPAQEQVQMQILMANQQAYAQYLRSLSGQVSANGTVTAPPAPLKTSPAAHWLVWAVPAVVGVKLLGVM